MHKGLKQNYYKFNQEFITNQKETELTTKEHKKLDNFLFHFNSLKLHKLLTE